MKDVLVSLETSIEAVYSSRSPCKHSRCGKTADPLRFTVAPDVDAVAEPVTKNGFACCVTEPGVGRLNVIDASPVGTETLSPVPPLLSTTCSSTKSPLVNDWPVCANEQVFVPAPIVHVAVLTAVRAPAVAPCSRFTTTVCEPEMLFVNVRLVGPTVTPPPAGTVSVAQVLMVALKQPGPERPT